MLKTDSDSSRIITAIVLLIIPVGCGINNVPTYDEIANAACAGVQNQYKRRADLIPIRILNKIRPR